MGAAPLNWLAKIGGDTLKTKAKLLSSAINELYDNVVKKIDIVGLDYIKAATADDLKNKVPEANAVKELNSNLDKKATKYTSKGSTTQPVYIDSNGVPTAISYTIAKSVPSNAVFTDTNTWRGIQNNLTSTSTTDSLSAYQGKLLNDKIENASLKNYDNSYADFCVEKRCGICQIMFNCTVESNITADAWIAIATVDTAYRPRTNWVDMKISKLGVKYGIMVETNGKVYIMPIGTQLSAGDYLISSMSYVSSTF